MFPIPIKLTETLSQKASTPKGRDRLERVLQAATEVLVNDGEVGLTMRRVAKLAKITHGNLQYYFETRDDLLCGMTECISRYYTEEFERIAASSAGNVTEKFDDVMAYLLQDISNPVTSSIFFAIWSIAKRNAFVAKAVDLLYAHGRAHISALIEDLNPDLPASVRELRAALILMQVEGLMVLAVHGKEGHPELDGLIDEALSQMRRIALDIVPPA